MIQHYISMPQGQEASSKVLWMLNCCMISFYQAWSPLPPPPFLGGWGGGKGRTSIIHWLAGRDIEGWSIPISKPKTTKIIPGYPNHSTSCININFSCKQHVCWWQVYCSLQSRHISEHTLESRPPFPSSQSPQFARTKMATETIGWMYPLPTKHACFAG